jgi:hypothetical protein
MAIIERLGADKPENSGPEKYAPPKRLTPDKLSNIDKVAAIEGEIREFVRRDVAFPRQQRNEADPAENLDALIRRVSGASIEEIDRVLSELQSVRDMLRKEGERVSREIAGYASLNHAAATAMRVITDSLTQWKSAPDKSAPRS